MTLNECIASSAVLAILFGCGPREDEPATADAPAPSAERSVTLLAVDRGAPKLLPVDEADPSFRSFRDTLLDALARKDTTALLAAVAPDIRTSFGADGGIEDFRSMWALDDPRSRVWSELARVLGMGGAFLSDSAFAAPYVYAIWPDSLDAFEYVAVTSPAAVVRTAPSASADTLGTASHSLLPYEDWRGVPESPVEPDTSWAGILLPDGRTGWLHAADVHSPVGWRAIFEMRDGRWRMAAFIAGD